MTKFICSKCKKSCTDILAERGFVSHREAVCDQCKIDQARKFCREFEKRDSKAMKQRGEG